MILKKPAAIWFHTGQLWLRNTASITSAATEPELSAIARPGDRRRETLAGLVAIGLVTLVVIVLVVWWWLGLPPLVFGG